jgi:hypothetical protein
LQLLGYEKRIHTAWTRNGHSGEVLVESIGRPPDRPEGSATRRSGDHFSTIFTGPRGNG